MATSEQLARLDYLKNWVLARIDELLVGSPSLDVSGASLTEPVGYLEEELNKAARHLILIAPRSLVFEVAKSVRTGVPSGGSVTNLVISGTTAIATTAAGNNLKVGDRVTIAGASQTEYNGTFTLIAASDTTFQYTVSGTPVSPATGTVTWALADTLIMVSSESIYGSTAFGVPDDFLRFLRLRVNTWDAHASEWIDEDSPVYRRQRYATSRGTAERPVCAMVPYYGMKKIGKKKIFECWPAGTSAANENEVEEFVYAPETLCYDLPVTLEEPLVWRAAETVLLIMRNSQLAQVAAQKFVEALGAMNQKGGM